MKTNTIQATMKRMVAATLAAVTVLAGGPSYIMASQTGVPQENQGAVSANLETADQDDPVTAAADGRTGTVVRTEDRKAAKQLNKVQLKSNKATLYAGEYTTIEVKKLSGDQSKYVKFKSNRKKVATVNAKGEVTAKKKGTAVITATSKSNKKATAKFQLTVKAKPKKSGITINKKKLSVALGKTAAVKVTNLTGVSSRNVTFTSGNPAVATVSAKGVIKGVGTGSTTITVVSAVNKKVKAKCAVTVSQAATGIAAPKQVVLEPTKGIMINAMVLPGTVTDKNVTATSADPDIAWAQAEDGGKVAILAVKEGKTTVTVKTMDGKVSTAIKVTVKKNIVQVKELELNETQQQGYARRIPVGGTAGWALQTKVSPANADNKALYFYSDDTGIATVDQKGYVTGVSAGYCRIYVMTCDGSGLTRSCEVHVDAAPVMREKEVYAYLREHPEKRSMYVAMNQEMYAELEASMEARGYKKEWIADHYDEPDGWHYVRGSYGDTAFAGSDPNLWYWDLTPTELAINIWEEE